MHCGKGVSQIWEIAQKSTRSMDARLQKLHEAIVKGLVPLSRIAAQVGTALKSDSELEVTMENLEEALSTSILLIASANYDVNMCRRDVFKRDSDEDFKTICSNKEWSPAVWR